MSFDYPSARVQSESPIEEITREMVGQYLNLQKRNIQHQHYHNGIRRPPPLSTAPEIRTIKIDQIPRESDEIYRLRKKVDLYKMLFFISAIVIILTNVSYIITKAITHKSFFPFGFIPFPIFMYFHIKLMRANKNLSEEQIRELRTVTVRR